VVTSSAARNGRDVSVSKKQHQCKRHRNRKDIERNKKKKKKNGIVSASIRQTQNVKKPPLISVAMAAKRNHGDRNQQHQTMIRAKRIKPRASNANINISIWRANSAHQ